MQSPAVTRAVEMMAIPIKDLPPLAVEFAKLLCAKVGMCGEVLLTAWAAYAQAVEGLECDDDLYQISAQDLAWFRERMDKGNSVIS